MQRSQRKSKSLRSKYKLALSKNNKSGSAQSSFPWMKEMDRNFRGDPSIEPLRTTESEAPRCNDNVVTEEENDFAAEGSTVDTDSAVLVPGSASCDPEAAMEPARRLAFMRKRKQRASAAAQLNSTLSKYMQWVKFDSERKRQLHSNAVQKQYAVISQICNSLESAASAIRQVSNFVSNVSCSCADGPDSLEKSVGSIPKINAFSDAQGSPTVRRMTAKRISCKTVPENDSTDRVKKIDCPTESSNIPSVGTRTPKIKQADEIRHAELVSESGCNLNRSVSLLATATGKNPSKHKITVVTPKAEHKVATTDEESTDRKGIRGGKYEHVLNKKPKY
ncbi:hypothetical protein JRQ81_012099 [Phrynocephalus forsythii]|uniref:Uncharacterized protein n=1 Tax=Phrynocephalus forsythii TaxID=171643 RepID=A0A9Q1APR1_9SAUR|nr:hypothetical protein JRQ81_012099 [Phrynocephalus forsythii]